MSTVITGLVTLITTSFNSFLTGIGSGVTDFFKEVFLTNTAAAGETPAYELSVFAQVSFVVLGVSLAIGLSTLVINWIRNRRVG